jgi:antitoxin (DNA-binding transcriptional repressor) of toxin-antitoxin stability system
VKMGIKEFRERISEVTASGEPVVITNHGKPVGSFAPFKRKDPKKIQETAEEIMKWQDEMRAKGIDLEAVLSGLGLDPWGVPLDVSDR